MPHRIVGARRNKPIVIIFTAVDGFCVPCPPRALDEATVRQVLAQPGWRPGNGGSQHALWHDPSGRWVLKVPRRSLARLGTLLVCSAAERARVRELLSDLLVPRCSLSQPRWQAAGGRAQSAREGWLMPHLQPEDFLADALWRRPDPARAALGVAAQLDLLLTLAGRGWVMLDFISDNFAWFDGSLRISDPDLIVNGRKARSHQFAAPAWRGFRRGLLPDYAGLLELRAAEAQVAGDDLLAQQLRNLAQRFGEILPSLPDLACQNAQGVVKSAAAESVNML